VIDTRTDAVTVTVALFEVTPEKVAETDADPAARPLACPFVPAALLTDTTEGLDDVQVADAVTSCEVPSEKTPVAMNCWLLPTAMLAFGGVTAMETRVASLTVSDAAFEVCPLNDAEIAVLPGATETASPGEAIVLPTTAIVGTDELQVAADVRFWVKPPDNRPVAVNCCDVPRTIDAVSGVTEIAVKSADVNVVVPVTVPNDAVIMVEPVVAVDALAKPPTAMVATAVFDEFQVTKEVRSCVAPVKRVPVAESWTVVPPAMVGSPGDSARETSGEAVSSVDPVMDPKVAVMVVAPRFAAVTSPLPLTDTTPGSADCHVTDAVRLFVVPFS
jgi:hypothetical protein